MEFDHRSKTGAADNSKRAGGQLERIIEELDTVALQDDTKYFEDYLILLERARKECRLLPGPPDFCVFSDRYRGNDGSDTAADKMAELYDDAEAVYLNTYNQAHIERRGKPLSLELTLEIPPVPIAVDDLMPTPSRKFLELEKAYFGCQDSIISES